MALATYNKYNKSYSWNWQLSEPNSVSSGMNLYNQRMSSNYIETPITGSFNYDGDVQIFSSAGGNWSWAVGKYFISGNSLYQVQSVQPGPTYCTVKLIKEYSRFYYDIRGSFVETITAENGTYPANGVSGSYWYEFVGLVNTAPTVPASVSAPTTAQKAGTTVTVSWGTSTDAEKNPLTYYLEFFNGSAWIDAGNTASTSKTFILPTLKIANSQFRIRAFDGKLYSGYKTSSTFSVFTNTAPTISGNANEDLGNKNMPFSVTYSVNDIDSDNILNVVEKLNGNQINATSNAPRNQNFTINISRATLDSLPLNQKSTIQVSVTDGMSTAYKTITFTRVNNGPIINNTDSNLGIVSNVAQKYVCKDAEGNAFTVVETVDDIVLKNFNAVDGTEYTTNIPINVWFKLTNGVHKYTITATDSLGASTLRTFTFTKKETVIESTGLTNIITTDAAAIKILLTPNWSGKENADVLFEVCNNAFDAVPTWENATSQTLINKPYVFANKVKTAAKWGINIRFKLSLKTGATSGVELYGLGGAFE